MLGNSTDAPSDSFRIAGNAEQQKTRQVMPEMTQRFDTGSGSSSGISSASPSTQPPVPGDVKIGLPPSPETHGAFKTSYDYSDLRRQIKLAFLVECARAGLTTPEAIATRAEERVKSAWEWSDLLTKPLDAALTLAVGAPVVAGGLAGFLGGKFHNAAAQPDAEALRYGNLAQTYDRLTDRARKQKALGASPAAREGRLIPM